MGENMRCIFYKESFRLLTFCCVIYFSTVEIETLFLYSVLSF